jgi:hypothetical protein
MLQAVSPVRILKKFLTQFSAGYNFVESLEKISKSIG